MRFLHHRGSGSSAMPRVLNRGRSDSGPIREPSGCPVSDPRPCGTCEVKGTAPESIGGPSPLILSLSERDFTTKVIDRAKARGWRVFHPLPARTSKGWRTQAQGTPKGFPDCVIAQDGVLLLVELKSQKGKLTEEQKDWLHHTNGAVWRPKDWQRICEVLDLPARAKEHRWKENTK